VRHVLVDDAARSAGVIDWGDVHVGHPALDLALAHTLLPPAVRDAFRSAYGPIDAATWALARFRAIYHSAMLLRYAHATADADLLRESRQALRWAESA